MTEQQQASLSRCRADLGPCIEDRYELLADFMRRLGFPNPQAVGEDLSHFLPDFAAWLDRQTLDAEDEGFILLRLSVFIGKVIAQRLGGGWFLDERPDSPHFATYVVGRFTSASDGTRGVNPFVIARDYLRRLATRGPVPTPMPGATVYITADGQVVRSFPAVLAEVEAGLRGTLRP